MSAMTAVPQVNGFKLPTSSVINEVEEYEKILRLRDEIFAGTHPRLTVPAHAIRKVSHPPTTQLAVASQVSLPSPRQSQLPGLAVNNEEGSYVRTAKSTSDAVPAQAKHPLSASGIDPVLLTKSDELLRAEAQIHRQRLEKSLKEQFEHKRLDARRRPAPGEAKPDFDIAVVLDKALQVAKPLDKPYSTKDDASASESFDENSLYSSRGPDSTPEAGELEDSASSQNQTSFVDRQAVAGPADSQARFANNVAPTAPLQRTGSRTDHVRPSPPQLLVDPSRNVPTSLDLTGADNDDEDEEGEYSPPEAMEQFTTPQDANSQSFVDSRDPRSRPLRRYSEIDEQDKRPGSPSDGNIRINTRNRNGRANQRGRGGSPNGSPDATSHNPHPKKKRKLDRKNDKQRRKHGGGSPDVKDEPVSPPPFHDVQPLGAGRLRPADQGPIVLDDTPTQDIRYAHPADRYIESPGRLVSGQAEQIVPLSEPRVVSRVAMRPPRDELDLRRVASMHNMRAEQPREYVEQIYESPLRARAPSYVRVDSPMRMEAPPQQMIYEREANQGVRVSRTPAPAYHEMYSNPEPEIRYVPQQMAPATVERIVVDQYGRRFREIVDAPASFTPRAVSSFAEHDVSPRHGGYESVGRQSLMYERDPDIRYAEEMPPPRVARQPIEVNPMRREVYEPLPAGRSGSVRPVERTTRPPIYIDDPGEFREPARMASVRPQAPRYEERVPPVQMISRASSVRPSAREGSVFIENRPPVRHEYTPMEAPRYRVVEQQPRYIDAQGREIVMEEPIDARYVQRYG